MVIAAPQATMARTADRARLAAANVDKWALWIGGRQGARLRGANIWQKLIDPLRDGDALGNGGQHVGPPYERDEFRDLARLGANYVNVSHAGIFSERAPYVLLPEVLANLDRLLDAIEAADMFAVVAFRTGPGRNEAAFGDKNEPTPLHAIFTDTKAQDAWVAMWRYAAAHYRGRGIVVGYDLMVEPNAGEALFGSPPPDRFYAEHARSPADFSPLAARIVSAIREVDFDTPCIVEPMGFASSSWLPYFEVPFDARTLVAVHVYEPHAYTHPTNEPPLRYPQRVDAVGNGNAQTFDRSWFAGLAADVVAIATRAGRPAAVSEFGVTRWAPGSAEYLGDAIDAFDAVGMNHAVWLWESRWTKINYDAFDVRHGPRRDERLEVSVESNALLRVLSASWAKNKARPSNGGRVVP
jgi:hypothetical protein